MRIKTKNNSCPEGTTSERFLYLQKLVAYPNSSDIGELSSEMRRYYINLIKLGFIKLKGGVK